MTPFVICFSGKRKSGKDYVSAHLKDILVSKGLNVVVQGISFPLKDEYARLHNLDANALKTSGPYKETYREDMVAWSETVRSKDPHYFCRLVAESNLNVDVLIVSDCRRPTDIEYFQKRFKRNFRHVRIMCDAVVRESRGFHFKKGIDDNTTECALDNYEWDDIIVNNENGSGDAVSFTLRAKLEGIAVDILSSLNAEKMSI